MKTSLLARAALGLALLASSPALADIRYIGTGFTRPAFEPYGETFAPDDPVSLAYVDRQPARQLLRAEYLDPRVHVISWRGSDEDRQFLPTMAYEVPFAGPLGIADVAYLPIRGDGSRQSPSAAAFQEPFPVAIPEIPTFVMMALGAAAIALGARRQNVAVTRPG